MGGPSINPIEPLLHMRCSNRDAARRDANVANMSDRADAMLSIGGKTAILYFYPVVKRGVRSSMMNVWEYC